MPDPESKNVSKHMLKSGFTLFRREKENLPVIAFPRVRVNKHYIISTKDDEQTVATDFVTRCKNNSANSIRYLTSMSRTVLTNGRVPWFDQRLHM